MRLRVRQSIIASNDLTKQAYIERFKRTLLSRLTTRYIDKLNETITEYNNTKHHSLNDTPNNRYNQNPSRGIIVSAVADIQEDEDENNRRKKKRKMSTNERKRKRTNNDEINRKKLKIV